MVDGSKPFQVLRLDAQRRPTTVSARKDRKLGQIGFPSQLPLVVTECGVMTIEQQKGRLTLDVRTANDDVVPAYNLTHVEDIS